MRGLASALELRLFKSLSMRMMRFLRKNTLMARQDLSLTNARMRRVLILNSLAGF